MSLAKRKLAAIMFTDMVGYTALGQRDESLSIALVEEQRKLIRPIIHRHEGKEIKTIGDAFLVEFPSALDAVRCAYDIQRAAKEFNMTLPIERRIHLRVGVHLGDVLKSKKDVSGDTVNVASRIESLAEDGGVCITRQVHDQIQNKFEIRMQSIGPRVLKNVTTPLEIYKLIMPWDEGKTVSPEKFDTHRIAILPLSNLSPDPNDEYFADGMTEELISTISKVGGLKVVSRTSVMGYKKTGKKLKDIAQELGVGALVEGSIRKSGNRIRITIQLLDANTDEHLWSSNYDRQLDDIFAIQSDVSEQVASALRVRLAESEKERVSKGKTSDMTAFQNYLFGKQLLQEGSEASTRRAIKLFDEAVNADPMFAEAYVGLGRAYELLGHHSHIGMEQSYKLSRPMIEKALKINQDLAEGHATLGYLNLIYDWNLDEAEREFKKAIGLEPSNAFAHYAYSRCLAAQGKLEDAANHAEAAAELDPLNSPTSSNLGEMYWLGGRAEEAFKVWGRVKELFPNSDHAYFFSTLALLAQGKYMEAELEISHLSHEYLEEPLGMFLRGMVNGNLGKREEALKIANELQKLVEKGHSSGDLVAGVYDSLNNADEFFKWAEEAVRLRHWELYILRNHGKMFPKLSSDPRWAGLLAEAGLSQYM